MKKLYTHENRMILFNLKNLLEESGIKTRVRNEFVGGGIGDLPAFDTWPELWVINDLDYDRALQLIEDASADSPTASWRCRKCGETNEGQFAACWNCGASV